MGGEVLDQFDLLVGEGANFLAVNDERADQFVLLQHRNGYERPNASEFNGSSDFRIVLFSVGRQRRRIGAMHHCFSCHHASKGKVSA